ncbi:MAG: phosphoserine phosphatase SerB [Bdellovibrionales bacterium]|nr:phosphoserine phosphatase SerB [Bdellovibrionales bacterium]
MTPTAAHKSVVLITVAGPDAPGITSQLTGILADGGTTILDIGQAVIHGLLSLSILFELNEAEARDKTIIKDLLFKATELGMKLDFRVMKPDEITQKQKHKAYHYAVTLMAERVSAPALHHVTAALAKNKINIDEIARLSEDEFSCVEMLVSTEAEVDRRRLRKELLEIASQSQVDIALQAEGLYRRAKRLVVFDMDSTLIQNEVIDEFARECGAFEAVSEITHTAMKGKMEFDESLRLRVEKLKGLTNAQMDRVFSRIQLTPGAKDLIRVLKQLGYKTALISGGFTSIADRIKSELGIDFAYANQLEMSQGVATGKVIPPIVNAQRKADLLDLIAQQERIHLDQVIAIGDGANDIPMLEKAGLGIAFNAKAVVRERADLSLSQKSLKSVLYLLGISGRDLQEILKT